MEEKEPSNELPRVSVVVEDDKFQGCFPVPDARLLPTNSAMILLWSSLGKGKPGADTYPLGSCFMIGEGLVAAATHLLDYPAREISEAGYRQEPHEYRFNLGIVEPMTGLTMQVIGSTTFTGSEITFLHVQRHPSLAEHPLPPPLVLRTSRIRADEPLILLGFPNQDVETIGPSNTGLGGYEVAIVAEPHMGVGMVRDENRAFLIHDSTIVVEGIEAMPGMSGGPVFDEANRVIGLISSSMQGAGHTNVARWSQAFKTDHLGREFTGALNLRTSDGQAFSVYIHNQD